MIFFLNMYPRYINFRQLYINLPFYYCREVGITRALIFIINHLYDKEELAEVSFMNFKIIFAIITHLIMYIKLLSNIYKKS